MAEKTSFLSRIFSPRKSKIAVKDTRGLDGTNNRINTTYSNEGTRDPIGGNASLRRRGIQVYTLAQILPVSGRDETGTMQTSGVEQPYFFLQPMQRNEIFKLSTPVFGIVTSRMNRIAGLDFSIIPTKHKEDKIVDELKMMKQLYDEYRNTMEPQYISVRAILAMRIRNVLRDALPDLSNFGSSLIRWKKVIQNKQLAAGDEIKEWLLTPNAGVKWSDYVKKVVYSLMVHGAEATYKKYDNQNRITNFDSLPAGTVFRLKSPYFDGIDGYVQVVSGYEPQIMFSKELMYLQYLPTSAQNYPMIPLEALINKIAEGLLFDRLMAEQADGTKPPEKLVVVTNNQNPFGDFDNKEEIPISVEEQQRIEKKLSTPTKGAVMTFAGNSATVVDMTRENTMTIQNARQKDIREDVALVFNTSNMEANLTGSDKTSGRSTSESQSEIEQGKGITPILKIIEAGISQDIIPYRYGFGYSLEFMKYKNDADLEKIDKLRLDNGKVTINELREEDNMPQFDGEEFNKPRTAKPDQPGTEDNPLVTQQL